jgi:hypothetical protein
VTVFTAGHSTAFGMCAARHLAYPYRSHPISEPLIRDLISGNCQGQLKALSESSLVSTRLLWVRLVSEFASLSDLHSSLSQAPMISRLLVSGRDRVKEPAARNTFGVQQ